MIQHTIIAVALQVAIVLCSANWWAGAAAGAFYFVGREFAQAEYRVIYSHYGRKRANAPWWCGFERRAWTRKGMLDWVVPSLVVVAFAIAAQRIFPMS